MIDLTPFCSTNPARPDLAAPWSAGDYTYASNGDIGVEVPRRADVAERAVAPNLPAILTDAIKHAVLLRTMPDGAIPEQPKLPCEECAGTGTAECPCCSHVGRCPDCGGTGTVDAAPISVEISPGRHLAARYVALLRTLPGLQIDLAGQDHNAWEKSLHCFIFDGGRGAVMDMSRASANGVSLVQPEQADETVGFR